MIACETTSLETQSTNQSDCEKVSNRRGKTRGQLQRMAVCFFFFLRTSYKYTSSFGADRPSGGSVGWKVHINDPVNIENSPHSMLPAGQSHWPAPLPWTTDTYDTDSRKKHFNHSYLGKHTSCTRLQSQGWNTANEHLCHNQLFAKLPLKVLLGCNDPTCRGLPGFVRPARQTCGD